MGHLPDPVEAVLSGVASYDDLTDDEQARVREEWEARDEVLRAALDFTKDAGAGFL